MKKWFTSDWHFGHRNLITYCKRPFKDVEEMNAKLVELWNNTVAPEDTVYFEGDFSLNPKWSRDLVPKLNGNKILIMGNHDACFPHKYNKKALKMIQRYSEDGWKGIYTTLPLVLKDGTKVLLSHFPYAPKEGTANNPDLRYLEHRPVDYGGWLLCGHLHGWFKKNGKMIDVGIDAHEMKILSEDDVIALIKDEREFIPSHLTQHYKERKGQGDEGDY